jgi:hypothetical protein
MPKISSEKWAELEGFWRHHHEAWKQSPLNQREYCELHGLPLKRFGNWRDRFKAEEDVRQAGLLYRRGGSGHMSSHMSDRENPVSTGYVRSVRVMPQVRRDFRLSDKKRIVAEAMAPGASVAGVARRYGIDRPLLCRWKRELAPSPPPVFLDVAMSDGPDAVGAAFEPAMSVPSPGGMPVIIERPRDEIEVELVGGRRMRFARDTDPQALQAMIAMLEGAAS